MISNNHRGLFVTFEGIDGSGKSTQANALLRKAQQLDLKAVLYREPGGTRISEQIRQILLSIKHKEIAPITELLLYSAARAQLTVEMILPALTENDLVICDRYFDSTIAYQGFGRQVDLEFINALTKEAARHIWPDVTFLVEVSLDIADIRAGSIGRPDRLEMETDNFKQRVVNGYDWLANKDPDRVIRLDGSKKVDELSDQVWDIIKPNLEKILGTIFEEELKVEESNT